MFESLEEILIGYGYAGLFLASFMASTILPFGSEGLLVLLVYKKLNLPALVLVASAGNFLGACTSYYIGLKGRKLVEKYLRFDPKEIEKAEKIFTKYGSFVLLFTWIPLIGDAITVASGILRLKFWIFSILVFTGKFVRYVIVAYSVAVFLV
jgi:membrane protein YqaA with SNARE-associated domain